MRLAFQLICRLERSIFLDKISKCYQQLRQRHKQTKTDTVPTGNPTCEKKCLDPKPKKSFWNIFKKKQVSKGCDVQKKVINCETEPRLVSDEQAEYDLEKISEMGGTAYPTCGPAYILQKDAVEMPQPKIDLEEKILEEMMKHPSLKGQCDPMPPFESVEKRLLDLSERKLHPSYKWMMTIPKRTSRLSTLPKTVPYKMRSGPILPEEIPKHLKINRDLLEKKNIFYEFKKAQIPQQLLSRLSEMQQNERPTMQRKVEAKKRAKQEGT